MGEDPGRRAGRAAALAEAEAGALLRACRDAVAELREQGGDADGLEPEGWVEQERTRIQAG